ncbi:MAG: hypothetical protein KBB38_00660 [Bacteroidia bacterium]|jgi:YD repeat-containing protein|uniref:hypothetical protein n=1 Tax=Candidatus Pollutiaquabacter sp. TaxID=3416354 RepID=UPI001A56BCA2|nr:hypothetical protein [Bacteroidota bacterium]MBL7947628.1 hypothetical protein [Bacteroidia bacterium]MBP6009526.1 hypothetical protein [Bacteroidia bacterium]MBP7268779.1 hypothetical protein [Bacteroidia bacterium]MBP7771611.1 hypothetical protein [Bacteroidia bacterium]
MAQSIKTVRRFNQLYRNFSFSELMAKADEEFLESVTEMDAKGNIVEESKFDSSGELEERNTYRFGPHGKLEEHVLFYAVDDVTERRVLQRDEKGLLLEEVRYYGDDTGERLVYTYGDKDLLVSLKRYDEEGDFDYEESFSYDANDSLTMRERKRGGGVVVSRMRFSPEGEGTKLEEEEFDEAGKPVSTTVSVYNKDGKEVSSVQRNVQGKLISSVSSVYDEHGNILERKHQDFYSKITRFTYDEQHRLLTQELFDGSGLLLRKNVYEYDNDGRLLTEQNYEIDTSRGGRDKHYGSRYEYEYY